MIIEIVISFFVNLISSVVLIIIIDKYNKSFVKRKFFEDSRTNELLTEGITFEYYFFYDLIEDMEFKVLLRDHNARKKDRIRKRIFKWFDENKSNFEVMINCISSERNEILYSMIDHTFFIFNNFNLLKIKNNIKNRTYNFKRSNLIEEIQSIENPFIKYERIMYFIKDLKCYYQYFNELIEEINYLDNLLKNQNKLLKYIRNKEIRILYKSEDNFIEHIEKYKNEIKEYRRMIHDIRIIKEARKPKEINYKF